MLKNKWKNIPECDGYKYNGTQVKSLRKYPKEVILKTQIGNHGYLTYCLRINKKCKRFLAHRLFWKYYFGSIPKGKEINHINGIKIDNQIHNLELVTHKQNEWHKRNILGKHNKGECHGKSKLNRFDIIKIKKMYISGKYSQKEIGKVFKITQVHVSSICKNRSWKHLNA